MILWGKVRYEWQNIILMVLAQKTGSANLVTGVVFDFRGYDTMGEAVVLVTAVLGVLTILRIKGKEIERC